MSGSHFSLPSIPHQISFPLFLPAALTTSSPLHLNLSFQLNRKFIRYEVLVTLKLLASLGQICHIIWAGNCVFSDRQGDRAASWLRQAIYSTQMEAMHSAPLSQNFFEL